MKEEIEQLARKLFNPYAEELRFNERDWEVFLNRLSEIEQTVREDDIKSLIDIVEESFKEWFSKDWKTTKYQANYPDNPLEDFMKIIQSQLK